MFAWLGGPGENFRYPLPNSTNYLSAYDKRGNLLRQPESSEDPQRPTGPETEATRALDDAAVETKKLPKENREDLRPFPLNHHFVSQPVLSDELRNEIWHRVQVEGKSVRQVSVELQVEMRRVGAVVRLVELERRMKAEVCEMIWSSHCRRRLAGHYHDELQPRLVFQTHPNGDFQNKLQLAEILDHIYQICLPPHQPNANSATCVG